MTETTQLQWDCLRDRFWYGKNELGVNLFIIVYLKLSDQYYLRYLIEERPRIAFYSNIEDAKRTAEEILRNQ